MTEGLIQRDMVLGLKYKWASLSLLIKFELVKLYEEILGNVNLTINVKCLLPFQGSMGSVGLKGYRGDSGEEVIVVI